jgi:hypothetical protein
MALYTTLHDLKEDIRREVERLNNAKFEQALPRVIASAEHRMFYGADEPLKSEPLRLRIMEEDDTVTLVDGEAALPAGYLQAIRLQYDGSPKTSPTYEAPHSFHLNRYTDTSGSPTRYTIEGSTLYVSPPISDDVTLWYYKQPDTLEDDTDTNAVLTTYPMLYFHAALVEAYSYLRNPNEMQKQAAAYVSLAAGLGRSEAKARRGSSSPLAPRVPGWRS